MEFMLNRKLPNITVTIPLKRQFIDRIMHFTFRYFLSQKQRNLRRKKKISSEGHILFAFDELKCKKKQLKHLVREKKNKQTETELLESDDLVDGVVSMETVGNATAELTTRYKGIRTGT